MTPLHLAVREGAVGVAATLVKNSQAAYFAAFLDRRTPRGKAALASGDLEKGYDICTALLRDDPRNENVNFAQGMASHSTERYSLAKLAFERVLEINPGNDRARTELGRTHLAMGNLELAARYLREALSRIESEEARRKIEQYLRQAGEEKSRSKTQFRLYAGYLDDSNINVGPDSDTISISPIIYQSQLRDSLTVKESSQPLEAQGGFASLMFSEIYDAGASGGWLATGDFAYYQNWLDGEPDYESIFAQLVVGAKRMRRRDLCHIPLKIAHITSGHEPLVNIYGVQPRFVYVSGAAGRMQWTTVATAEFRDFDELDDRDGPYFALGESFKQYFGGGKHSISMGLQAFHDHADAGSYENSGTVWSFGIDISLPWAIALYGRGRYTRTEYSERETLAPETRSDTQNQAAVGIKRDFGTRIGLDINYQHTQNNSTFTLYQYDRSVTTVSTYLRF